METIEQTTDCCDTRTRVLAAKRRVATVNEAIFDALDDIHNPMVEEFATGLLQKSDEFVASLKQYDCEH